MKASIFFLLLCVVLGNSIRRHLEDKPMQIGRRQPHSGQTSSPDEHTKEEQVNTPALGSHHEPLQIDPTFFRGEEEETVEEVTLPPHDVSLDHVEDVNLILTETGEFDLSNVLRTKTVDLTELEEPESPILSVIVEKPPESTPLVEDETVEEIIVQEGADYPQIEVIETEEEVEFVEEDSIALEPEAPSHGPFEIEPSSDSEGPFQIQPSSDHQGPFPISEEEINEIHVVNLPEEEEPEEPVEETPVTPTHSPTEAPDFSISDWLKPLFDFSGGEEPETEVKETEIDISKPIEIFSEEPVPEVAPIMLEEPDMTTEEPIGLAETEPVSLVEEKEPLVTHEVDLTKEPAAGVHYIDLTETVQEGEEHKRSSLKENLELVEHEIEDHPTIAKGILVALGGCVLLFCCYTFCCKKKKNTYAEFEDFPKQDEIAHQEAGIINESIRDDFYDCEGVAAKEEQDKEYAQNQNRSIIQSSDLGDPQNQYSDDYYNSNSRNLELDRQMDSRRDDAMTGNLKSLDVSVEVSSHYSNDLKFIEDVDSNKSHGSSFNSSPNTKNPL